MIQQSPFQRIKLYLWIGLTCLVIRLLIDLISETETFQYRIFNNIWQVLYVTFLHFLFFEYAVPFIKLRWQRLLAAPFILFGFMLMYSMGAAAWRGVGIAFHIYTPLTIYDSFSHVAEAQMAYSMGTLLLFGIAGYSYKYIQLKQSAQQLLIQKQKAELNYLKAQTNPHFLFNTLNNIYSLARDKSDLAPESILRLSKILRYMLYETSGTYVSVEQELKVINDYIELEKLRYDASVLINFSYDIEDAKQSLPPLLLIPLVENAFKHGLSETRNSPFLEVHLSIKNRQLIFTVKNSSEKTGDEISIAENIGLSNLRRQLELLYTDFSLQLRHQNGMFSAVLTINLSSHV
jgi:two-component system, LytTR family, sensor kinase